MPYAIYKYIYKINIYIYMYIYVYINIHMYTVKSSIKSNLPRLNKKPKSVKSIYLKTN